MTTRARGALTPPGRCDPSARAVVQLSQGYPLKRLFMSLVADHDLIELLRLDVKMLSNLMTKIEDGYDPNVPCTSGGAHPRGTAAVQPLSGKAENAPRARARCRTVHNSLHAADVLQTFNGLLCTSSLLVRMTPIEKVCAPPTAHWRMALADAMPFTLRDARALSLLRCWRRPCTTSATWASTTRSW